MFMVSGSFELLPAAALAEARRKLDVRLRRKLFCWTMPPTLPHMRDDRSLPVGTVAVVPGASREGGRTEVPGTAVVLRRPCEDMRRSRADMPRGRDMSGGREGIGLLWWAPRTLRSRAESRGSPAIRQVRSPLLRRLKDAKWAYFRRFSTLARTKAFLAQAGAERSPDPALCFPGTRPFAQSWFPFVNLEIGLNSFRKLQPIEFARSLWVIGGLHWRPPSFWSCALVRHMRSERTAPS